MVELRRAQRKVQRRVARNTAVEVPKKHPARVVRRDPKKVVH